MAFKMKGFPMIEGTEPMKAMSAMSPKKVMSDVPPQSKMTEDELKKAKNLKGPVTQDKPDDEPVFPGGDITKGEWDSMTPRQRQDYVDNQGEDM